MRRFIITGAPGAGKTALTSFDLKATVITEIPSRAELCPVVNHKKSKDIRFP